MARAPNSALLPDAFSSLRYACGAAKRERYVAVADDRRLWQDSGNLEA